MGEDDFPPRGETLLSMGDLSRRLALSRPTIYGMVSAGTFPRPVSIGRSSRWLESEVSAWIAARGEAQGRSKWVAPAPLRSRVPAPIKKMLPTLGRDLPPGDPETPPDMPEWPTLMRKRMAAQYLDISDAMFAREVKLGTLPPPVCVAGAQRWSRHALDAAVALIIAKGRWRGRVLNSGLPRFRLGPSVVSRFASTR